MGIGGEGEALPAGRLLSLMGLMIQVAPVAAQIRELYSGGLSVVGCAWVLGVLSPPGHLLAPSCGGLLWNLCFLALGRPAMHRH